MMSYLELLKLASPEAVVVLTALVVLSIGLLARRPAAVCGFTAALGILVAIGAIRSEIFSVRQYVKRIHAFRNQPDLRYDGNNRSRSDCNEIGEHVFVATACSRNRHDTCRFRVQDRCGVVSSVGAQCISRY